MEKHVVFDSTMKIEKNISLKAYNSFGIDVKTAEFVSVSTLEEALNALQYIKQNQLSLLILGGGSNVLLLQDWPGIVLLNRLEGIELLSETSNEIKVKVGAGYNWHQFVLYSVNKGWAGVENLSLIPGCVGGAPIQNIGAYGVELKETFVSLQAIDLNTLEILEFDREQCAFGYRDSIFKNEWKNRLMIVSVTFQLAKNPTFKTSYGAIADELKKMEVTQLTIKSISDAVISIRQSKLPNPAEIGNAGSFFKNPVVSVHQAEQLKLAYPEAVIYPVDELHSKVAAGWMIEKAGWKGYRNQDYGVHAKQALVLVNYGKANGREIFKLSEEIIQSVITKFGIELEREVNMI